MRFPSLRRALASLAALALPALSLRAQVEIVTGTSTSATSYGLEGPAYTQSFDTLPVSGAFTWTNGSTVPGWHAVQGNGVTNTAATTLTGSGNPNDLVIASVGASGSTDRALTYHTRTVANPTFLGLHLANRSGRPLTSFSLSFRAEQWRESTDTRTITLAVQYRIGAGAADLPASSGWTTLPGISATTQGGSGTAVTNLSTTALPVSVPDGSTLWLRWAFTNDAITNTNAHDILAIDAVQFSATAANVDRAPTIVTPPASQTVATGASATFSVTVDANPTATFQWMRGETPLTGATSSTLTLPNVNAADAGSYTVTATNSLGSVTSTAATLTVLDPPSIVTPPASTTANPGETAVFSVTAAGAAPLAYQWLKNGSPISAVLNPSAATQTLSLPSTTGSDSADYSVRVTNAVGTATSASASLVVLVPPEPPAFTAHPASLTAYVGGSASLSATATGSAPLTLQWQKDGTDLVGRTGATLNLNALTNADAGLYRCRATNAYGTATSNTATLTVLTPVTPPGLYVSPTGLDSAAGTFEQPTSLTRALTTVAPGGTIYLRGGTYVFNVQVTIARDNSGSDAANRKRLFAYAPEGGEPERPVFDFSTQPYGTGTNPRGLQIDGHYWHVRGLEVVGSADNGIFVAGNHNIIERCITRNNRDSGLQISRYSSTAADISEWPSYNLILNCESYDNYDSPPGTGENADGFACKLTAGPGNVFRGCVSHHNIDDGWDLFTKTATGPIGSVVLDRCIAYANGTLTDGTQNPAGDRNGFKLGGESIPVIHVVTRCIAFGNGKNGFTFNSNPGAIRMFNNLAWDNAQGNYKFDVAAPIFLNNVSLWTTGSGVNDRYGGNSGIATGTSNVFWFASGTPKSRNDQGIQVSAASFRSLAVPSGGFARNTDGSLALGDFGKPVSGSPLINKGTIPPELYWPELPFAPSSYYEGAADIGQVEFYLNRVELPDWKTTHALTGGEATDDADPDGDGVPNLLEYALGLAPRSADASSPQLPAVLVEPTSGARTLRYTRAKSAYGLSYIVETSTDLVTWTAATAAVTPVAETSTSATEEVALPSGAPIFVRLRVVTAP